MDTTAGWNGLVSYGKDALRVIIEPGVYLGNWPPRLPMNPQFGWSAP